MPTSFASFATIVVGVSSGPLSWPKFSHAGFSEARTEPTKPIKEIKLKKLKVELVPLLQYLEKIRGTQRTVQNSNRKADAGQTKVHSLIR